MQPPLISRLVDEAFELEASIANDREKIEAIRKRLAEVSCGRAYEFHGSGGRVAKIAILPGAVSSMTLEQREVPRKSPKTADSRSKTADSRLQPA